MSTAELGDIEAVKPGHSIDSVFAAGGDQALRAAYDAHGSLVYSYCRRALGEERAKDVTQEVFVSAWRAREQFDSSKGNLVAWLMGIAKNRLIDNLRAERRHNDPQFAAELAASEMSGEPVSDDVEQMGDRMLVASALKSLPERSRSVLEMVYFGDMTHQQAAERLSLPLGTVKSDVRRGLTSIRDFLEASHD